jgi:hypothetical protein
VSPKNPVDFEALYLSLKKRDPAAARLVLLLLRKLSCPPHVRK